MIFIIWKFFLLFKSSLLGKLKLLHLLFYNSHFRLLVLKEFTTGPETSFFFDYFVIFINFSLDTFSDRFSCKEFSFIFFDTFFQKKLKLSFSFWLSIFEFTLIYLFVFVFQECNKSSLDKLTILPDSIKLSFLIQSFDSFSTSFTIFPLTIVV